MNGQEIIELFRLLVDDTTELSSVEELALANRIYKQICSQKHWEFLRKSATGTQSITVPYVSLASDFKFFTENSQYTDISEGQDNSVSKVVFVGSNYQPYKIINYSDRRQYRDKDGYAYADLSNNRLYFTKQPTIANSFEYDYIAVPTKLALNTSPVFNEDYHPIIAYGMATDSFAIQLFDKAKSYANENQKKYDKYFEDLAYYNAQLKCN